ncbi:MAG: site-2 protease family protein [Bacillota bacterium]
MRIGRILGVELRVHPLFLALLAAATLVGLLRHLIILVCFLASHELAHLLAARQRGLKVKSIEFWLLGGVADIDDLALLEPGVEATVAAAGPVNNLLLAIAILLMQRWNIWNWQLLGLCFETNLWLLGLNLLPVLPLDGGRILRDRLAVSLGYPRATGLMGQLGRAAGVGGMLFSLWQLLSGRFYPAPFVIGLCMVASVARERAAAIYASLRQLINKKEQLRRDGILPVEELYAVSGTSLYRLLRHLRPGRYHLVRVVGEDLQPLGLLAEGEILEGLLEHGADCTIERLLV